MLVCYAQGVLPILLAAIPYTVSAFVTWVVAHSSQKKKELYFHTSIPLFLSGVFFAIFAPLTQVGQERACGDELDVMESSDRSHGYAFCTSGERGISR